MKQPTNAMYTKKMLATVFICTTTSAFADFNNAKSDYSVAPQNYHVWNEALKPVDLVNSILCFSAQLKASEFINKGPYLVLADEAACFNEDDNNSATAQSSGASNIPTYTKIIVDATRASANEPLMVKVWIPAMGTGEEQQSIKFKSSISQGASTENPFGIFTFNYNFYASISSNLPVGGGEIKTIDIPGKIGFTFYEVEAEEEGRVSSKSASVVMSSDRSEGIAFTANSQTDGNDTRGNAFGLAFNANNVLLQTANDYASLPFTTQDPNTGSEACLSRTEFDESVWRYNLFDATTGANVQINSGISFKYDSNNDGVTDSYGRLGYWGLWAEHADVLTSGDIVYADNHAQQNQTATPYTLLKAPGRLIKNTVEQLPISKTQGIRFNLWNADAQQANFQNWIVEYLTLANDGVASDGFYKIAGNRNGENGPMTVELAQPVAVVMATHESLNMNSDQLGGPVKYKNGDNFITFFKQEFINGSETASGQLLANGVLTLYCIERCPVGTLTAPELSTWNTPFSNPIQSIDQAIGFTFSTEGLHPLTLVRESNSEPVEYAAGLSSDALQMNQSPYAWGIRSGALVTADTLLALSEPWDISNPAKVKVFYEWETGANTFNQMVSIKDSNGVIQRFDKPIQFTYTHQHSRDRSGNAGEFDGKVVLLNYGGNDELNGIPSKQDSDGHYRALFTIADGTLLGPDNEYVIKAEEIEGTMKPTAGQCNNLVLAQPAAPVPTGTTDSSADIGDMPVVTSAPIVIAGVIQNAAP